MSKLIFESYFNNSFLSIGEYLVSKLKPIVEADIPIVFLCIGSDRCTGDSLGPLVGDKLKLLSIDNIHVYGDLESTVNATNLETVINNIKSRYVNPYIIAIDASLGDFNDVGKIIVKDSPLNPGKALNKDLKSIGDLSILGIVNISNSLQFLTLQNTRLSVVMKIANTIAKSILYFSMQIDSNNLLKDI